MPVSIQSQLRQRIFTVPTVALSVPTARRRARAHFAAWDLDVEHPVVETALFILTELLTNSVQHTAHRSPTADIILALGPRSLIVAVHDRHPHCPRPTPEPHADGSGGWGLRLVAELAAEALGSTHTHTDADEQGKTLLVRLPRPDRTLPCTRDVGVGVRVDVGSGGGASERGPVAVRSHADDPLESLAERGR